MRLHKLLAGLLLAAASPLCAAIVALDYDYKDGSQRLHGYLAYDDTQAKAPGVLIVPQWMGVTDYERGRARQIAELARSGADLDGVVSFHGSLDSPHPDDGRNIKAKVLVLHGADDPYVAKKDIEAFENELKSAKVDYQLVFYSGAVHAFTQPMAGNDNSKGAACNEKADKRSWGAMRMFFDELWAPAEP